MDRSEAEARRQKILDQSAKRMEALKLSGNTTTTSINKNSQYDEEAFQKAAQLRAAHQRARQKAAGKKNLTQEPTPTKEATTSSSSPDNDLLKMSADVTLQNMEQQPHCNGIRGRIVHYLSEKDRWVVRLHYTGKLLALPRTCLKPTVDMTRPSSYPDSEALRLLYYTAIAKVKTQLHLRQQLSERVRMGVMTKGPGALFVNLMDVTSDSVPKFLTDIDAILSPKQTCFYSNDEICQKMGKAWFKGRSTLSDRYEYGPEWPLLVQMSSLFVKMQPLRPWHANMAVPVTIKLDDPVEYQRQQDFYETYGMIKADAMNIMKYHFARYAAGNKPPLIPVNQSEHFVLTSIKSMGAYDRMAQVFSDAFGEALKEKIPPLGDKPLWHNHNEMDGYRNVFAFQVFCVLPVCEGFGNEGEADDTLDGWQILGFDTLTIWTPGMEKQMAEVSSPEERMNLFAADDENEIFDA